MSFQPMNNKPWCPEDGQLLQSLREKAGIDALLFARNNTVSLAQLRELEQGGESSFYSPLIKRSTGVKLLRKLGYEYPPEETPAPPEAESLDTAPLAASPAADVHSAAPTTPAGPISTPNKSEFWVKAPAFWGIGLSTLALLVFIGPIRQMAHTGPSSTSPLVKVNPSVHTSTAPEAAALPPVQSAPNTTAQPAPEAAIGLPAILTVTDKPATNSPSASASGLACDWQYRDTSTVFRQSEPLKPGNYVHFVAQADTTLCVLDQHNKLTTLSLAAGASKSVFGAAPFLVQTSDWQDLQVFFQGRRVHAAHQGRQHLQLLSQTF